MASSSPVGRSSRYPRASFPLSSPASSSIADFLSPDRNSEKNHKQALAEAKAEHERIRKKAEHVLWLHEQQEEQEHILETTRINTEKLRIEEEHMRLVQERIKTEEERLRAEKAAREEQRRLRDLAAQTIPPLSPAQSPAPKAQIPVSTRQPTVSTPTPDTSKTTKVTPTPALQPQQPTAQQTPQKPFANGITATKPPASVTTPTTTTAPLPAAPPAPTAPVAPAAAPMKTDPKKERAIVIHRNLKEIRKSVNTTQASQNQALKSRAGDLRREIRKCIGQLSFDKKGNQAVTQKLVTILKEALNNQVGSQMIDPSHFIFDQRQPDNQAVNNGDLPSLFIFLLNHLAKAAINQFINECSANTKTADPIGVLIASIFSDPAFQWRGKPLIDILIAKFYIVCPVLFGSRGLEKTEQGRDRVGWKRRGPKAWMPESEHYDRQLGLGAGYAAITLRDFSKSKKKNPYPMTHYWTSMARIVNTPPSEMSNTQCVVLKAMIQHYEQRFLLFYGSAAIAALRLALVDFPANAKSAGCKDSAVESLLVHGKQLKAKVGLNLA